MTLFLLISVNANAATWYVGTVNANDNVATHGAAPATPFASLKYAESQIANGDMVIIANGNYQEDGAWVSAKAATWEGESKDGVVVSFTNADSTRGLYLGNAAGPRIFRNFTLQHNNINAGPAYLVEAGAADVDATFNNVKFENGRTAAVRILTGRVGLTIENSEFVSDISSQDYVIFASGGYTVRNSTVDVGLDPGLGGIFYQAGVSAGEKVIIDGNVINTVDDDYIIRMTAGGYANIEITDNEITVPNNFSRTAIDLRDQIDEVVTGNTLNIPSEVASASGIFLQSLTGNPSVANVSNNVINLKNNSGYGIRIGSEGGVASVPGSHNGSTIDGNTVNGPATLGGNILVQHSIFVGYNEDINITNNRVEGSAYCIGVKHGGDAWTAGGVSNNTCTNTKWGVRVKGPKNVSITNNTIISDNGTNVTAIDVSQNGVGETSTGVVSTGNIISISSGEVYNFRDASDGGFSSDSNFFDLYGGAEMGNLNGQAPQATLVDWQNSTVHDDNSYVWDLDNPPEISFTAAAESDLESVLVKTFNINASGFRPYNMTFDYAAVGGTATGGGVDYTFVDGSANIAPGSNSTSISLAVNDDNDGENDETVVFELSNFAESSPGANVSFTYTIEDDDGGIPSSSRRRRVNGGSSPRYITEILSNGGEEWAEVFVEENQSFITTVEAGTKDPNAEKSFYVFDGEDKDLVVMDEDSGSLKFLERPDFENPVDGREFNRYVVVVKAVSDHGEYTSEDIQKLEVVVTDVVEAVIDDVAAGVDVEKNEKDAGTGDDNSVEKKPVSKDDGFQGKDVLSELKSIFIDAEVVDLYYPAAEDLFYQGVVDGYGDKTVRLNDVINRAEMAKAVLLAAKAEFPMDYSANYVDTEEGAWYQPYVNYAGSSKVMEVYPGNEFRPSASVSVAEAFETLVLAYGFSMDDFSADSSYKDYMSLLEEKSALPSAIVLDDPSLEITRGEVFEILSRLNRMLGSVDEGLQK